MTPQERKVMELALEALERSVATCFDQYAHQQVMSQPDHFINKAITAIKEALVQPEQEPVAWYHAEDYKTHFTTNPSPDLIGKYWKPLYTTPPQPKEPEQEPVAWEQFYPDIGKPQLKQLPQLSQEVVLQYPKEAVDWQKQQKEYAQQLPKETEQEPATKEQIREAMIFNLPLYTTPPQRKPLTDEQVREIAKQYALDLAFPYDSQTTPEMFARAIEAAHNIKE